MLSYWWRQTFVHVVHLRRRRPPEGVAIVRRGHRGPVVSHRRRQRNGPIRDRRRDPGRLVAVVIPSSIRVIASVNYRATRKEKCERTLVGYKMLKKKDLYVDIDKLL